MRLVAVVVLASLSLVAAGHSSSRSLAGEEEVVQKQVRQLGKMKCRPVRQKVAVKELLSPHNDLLDQRFWPEVVVVRRCLDSCSYCGNEMGVELRRCLPLKSKPKRFLLVYYSADGERLYGHFRAQEHSRCKCG